MKPLSRYCAPFLICFAALPLAFADSDLKLPPSSMDVPLETTDTKNLGTNDQDIGLTAGTMVPEFTAKAHNGEVVNLDVLLEDAPLLVVFYRGGWCPYCNVQIRQLTAAYPEFKQRNVFPVLISVDTMDGAALANQSYEIPFAVLSDPQLNAHEAFNVVMQVDEQTYKQYQEYGIDLEAWSGEKHHKIAVSSAFLVDKTGKVRWAHTSEDYLTRPSPEQLLAVIDSIDW